MRKRSIAGTTVLFVLTSLLTACTVEAADRASRPNIVFVLVDDLRWDALGCTGHPFLPTPNIDRIAAQGALFENAFVTTPLCSPSRASFLTGLHAHTHQVLGNGSEHGGHQLITFPRLLHQAGYATAYVGKWHMGSDDSPRPGFDRWVSFKGQGEYNNPTLNVDGSVVATEGYVTDILTDYAVEFLEQPHDKPLLLYLAHKAIHADFTPAERHQREFADQTIPRAPSVRDTLEGKPVLTRKLPREERPGQNPGTEDRVVLGQLRGMLAIDESVGRLFRVLESSGELDDTLVIFTSDNGFFWGEHGLGDKRAAYEESIRIPLLMRYPKLIEASSSFSDLVLNVDIAPTLIDLAGIAAVEPMHGRSLLSLLRNDGADWRESFLTEYFAAARDRIPAWQAIRTDEWKYIHYTEVDGVDELYDLKADPYELKNLIHQPDAQTALREMKMRLAQLIEQTK